MKISENFTSEEWLDRDVLDFCDKRNYPHTWFINPRLVALAEFYKKFFYEYYSNLNPNIVDVLIIINKPSTSGRGLRSPMYKGKGAVMSQHKFLQGFDCDIIFKYYDGTRKEVDYHDIAKLIFEYEKEFMEAGLTTIEDTEFTPGWLHSDIRWEIGQKHIKIVKP